jgi:cytochrome c oxidase assembly protein subunit 15
MVKSGLSKLTSVSHYRLALHLFTASLTLTYLVYILHDHTVHGSHFFPIPQLLRSCLTLLLLVVPIQIIYGGLTAGLKAGTMYNTFPLMNGTILTVDAAFSLSPLWINFFENPTLVQFLHRTFGWIILFLSLPFLTKTVFHQARFLLAIPFLTIIQFFLGVFTLLFQVPIVLGVLHQLTGILLWLAVFRSFLLTRKG